MADEIYDNLNEEDIRRLKITVSSLAVIYGMTF
jgi:hypothetical protein